MCLIALRWSPDAEWPLVVAANRDEFYQRESTSAHHWQTHAGLFAGLDKQAGGTWLGINTRGRFAAVTNFRKPGDTGTISRGTLTRDFLTGDLSASLYLQSLQENSQQYAGFNLLLAGDTGLWYFTNRHETTNDGNSLQQLPPGTYGLSNHLLDTPWPKVARIKEGFNQLIENQTPDAAALISLLHDDCRPADDALPDTGVGIERERFLSSCFIRSPIYGTRTSTVMILNRHGRLSWHEQHYGPEGVTQDCHAWELMLKPGWLASNQSFSHSG